MAALSITAGNVRILVGSYSSAISGEALANGDAVRLDAGKWWKTDANDTAKDDLHGVCILGASGADLPVSIAKPGTVVNIGATTAKVVYYAGATAGSWHPVGDLTTGWAVLPGLLARDTSGTCEVIMPRINTNTIL